MSDDAAVLVIVDGANVVGSVPDGWWRDRHGAAVRLRDALVPYATDGLPGLHGPVELVLVVEGAARGVASVAGVRVDSAPGSGDDLFAELAAAAAPERECVGVTADPGRRQPVAACGAPGGGAPTGPPPPPGPRP
ncbi:NTP pyrophosphohydrolase, partial [Streptomyces microflavus]|uniref:NTP pyrophosphohydrolase n=1 Tax=Streptomyces microflavus TaxID=1919 RepID=UPI00367F43F7